MATTGLMDLLFKLQYDTKLRMSKVRRNLLNALVRGSTQIQRAMTRSAGLMLDPRSQGIVEPVVFNSRFHPALPPVIKRRGSSTRLPFGGK
jgi:hypothetical protein